MILTQPYKSKTVNHTNESELTFLVNRYIIDSFAYLVQSKKIQHKEYVYKDSVLKAVYLFGMSPSEADIPDLKFPLIDEEKGWICFDLRRFYSVDKLTGEITPKRATDIDFLTIRNDLSGIWSVGGYSELYLFTLPQIAFADWISSLITNKLFGVDLQVKYEIRVVALLYYGRLFTNSADRTDELEKLMVRVREGAYSKGLFERVYNQVVNMETLEDFCKALYDVTGSVRLKDFTVGVLLRLVQTSWIGTDSKENVALALEYPPIWIAMCYSGLVNNGYKRTSIGDQIFKLGKSGEGVSFMKSMQELLAKNVRS